VPTNPIPTRFRPHLQRLARRALPIEQTILPHTSPPLPIQIEALDWQPDPFDAYCDRCGVHIGPHEADDQGCAHCRGSRFPWNQFVRLAAYDEPMVEWIHQIKFTRYVTLAHQLGAQLGERLLAAGLDPKRAVITPMPTTWRRRVSRGIDHAGEIARGAASVIGCDLVRYLARDHSPSQRAVQPAHRTRNVAKAFRPRRDLALRGWDVVLVDDVCTSGATLRAAGRELARLRPDMLWAAVLAVSDDDARRARRGSGKSNPTD
jgi:predicted amidophosphoribosyltransferase